MFVANEAHKPHLDELLAAGEGLLPISVDKAIEMMPLLNRDHLVAAAHEPDAKDLDVAALHQGWLKQVKQHGGDIRIDSEVLSGSNATGHWVLETKSGPVEADKIVNAAGPGAMWLLRVVACGPWGWSPSAAPLG